MKTLSNKLTAGPLLNQVTPNYEFGPLEKVQETEEVELYILRYPWDQNGNNIIDPEFKLITNDGVLATFGQTGLVSVVEQIEKKGNSKGELRKILERDTQGELYLERKNLPVDGIADNPKLTDTQLKLLIINYVYDRSRKLSDGKDNILSKLFHYWNADKFVDRFRDFSSLKSKKDILPDESDITIHVKLSDGCPYSCIYCPEGKNFEPKSMEEIIETIKTTRELQEKYHPKALDRMVEGFLNTSNLLLFSESRYKHLEIDPIEVVNLFKKNFPEVERLGTFLSVKSIIDVAERYGEDYFRKLAKAGLNRAYIGIETALDEGSRLLGKSDTYEDKLYAMSLLKRNGISVKAIVQVGVLGEGFYPLGKEKIKSNYISSERSIRRTIKLMNEAQPYRVIISEFIPYEGLKRDEYIKKGIIIPYTNPLEGITKEINMLNKGIKLEQHRKIELGYERYLPKNNNTKNL